MVSVNRRDVLRSMGATVPMGIAGCVGGNGGEFPEENITIVSPFDPGSIVSLVAREVEPAMEEELGVAVDFSHREGGGGTLGIEYVADQPGDGYTIVVTDFGTAAVAEQVHDTDYELQELTGVGIIAHLTTMFLAPSDRWESLEHLAEYGAENRIQFSSVAIGALLNNLIWLADIGVDLDLAEAVPMEGGAAIQALQRGDVDCGVNSASNAATPVNEGDIHAFFQVQDSEAVEADVPTLDELDMDITEITFAIGFLAPPDTPNEIVETLSEPLNTTIQDEEYRTHYEDFGMPVPSETSPEQADEEISVWFDRVAEFQEFLP